MWVARHLREARVGPSVDDVHSRRTSPSDRLGALALARFERRVPFALDDAAAVTVGCHLALSFRTTTPTDTDWAQMDETIGQEGEMK